MLLRICIWRKSAQYILSLNHSTLFYKNYTYFIKHLLHFCAKRKRFIVVLQYKQLGGCCSTMCVETKILLDDVTQCVHCTLHGVLNDRNLVGQFPTSPSSLLGRLRSAIVVQLKVDLLHT